MLKVTIAIPAYNQQNIIADTIESALAQNYEDKEILVIDDCSTDCTFNVCERYHDRILLTKNAYNVGFTQNAQRLIERSQTPYVVFLCGDDMFANKNVLGDIVSVLESNDNVGIVDRGYFQYMDGFEGACVAVREKDLLVSCVNPSGMGFRKDAMLHISNEIYMEVPRMVAIMRKEWGYKRLDYDTIAVRIHKNNQALDKNYYKGSLLYNWHALKGNCKVLWDFKNNYVCFKNRVGLRYLLKEIAMNIKLEPRILLHPKFWFFSLFCILIPTPVLRGLSDFYRHRIQRLWTKQIHRKYGPVRLNIGCGRNQRNDATNVDTTQYAGVDQVVDLSKYPWPWASESVDGIYASHVIEHLQDQQKFIYECLRILKPGGFLRLNLPHSSSVTSIGCFGHYRTFSWNTMHQYLGEDYYMFGKAKFRTVEKRINWWYEVMDTQVEVPKWMFAVIVPVNKILTFLANLSPRVCENLWCYWCGGFREVVWTGEKL